MKTNKLINDPVLGPILIPYAALFDIIDNPAFQRLRRIKQLGYTHLIYPGAVHTRFQHVLGAMYLADKSIGIIRSKGHEITVQEAEATVTAVLMHDIGHGPFSHSLEELLVNQVSHEEITKLYMSSFNKKLGGKLDLAIRLFNNQYPKFFLNDLISSQLDVDRLDYLKRDSFYTGVIEGSIGTERIISLFNVLNNKLVIEQKGVLSVENFLIARRMMYWQVYLHKTVVSAESLIINIIKRAKFLLNSGEKILCTEPLRFFLTNKKPLEEIDKLLHYFSMLDDVDIMSLIKEGVSNKDKVFSVLCSMMLNRQLFKVKEKGVPFEKEEIREVRKIISKQMKIDRKEAEYFVFQKKVLNNAYIQSKSGIKILKKNNDICSLSQISKMLDTSSMNSTEEKWFFCFLPYNL